MKDTVLSSLFEPVRIHLTKYPNQQQIIVDALVRLGMLRESGLLTGARSLCTQE